jgi:hypothetical protein
MVHYKTNLSAGFLLAVLCFGFPAHASCGPNVVSGTLGLISTICYLFALIVFIKTLFWGAKAYKKKEISSARKWRAMLIHIALLTFFISVPLLLRVDGFYIVQRPDSSGKPCCSVERMEIDTARYRGERQAVHSAALCGCKICYESAMFKPALKIENLLNKEVIVEGKEYLLNHLYPVGTNINDFRRGLKELGLKEVQNFCRKSRDDEGFAAFHIYMPRNDGVGTREYQNIILAYHDSDARIHEIKIDVAPSGLYYDVPDEAVLELAENNMIDAQRELARRYGQYTIKGKSDVRKSYFWRQVHERHRASTMQDMPEQVQEKPSLVSEWWDKVTSFSFKKKRLPPPTYMEWVSANLSSTEMKEIESEAQKWWSEHRHIEFCTPVNFEIVPEVKEYISLSKAAEKVDSQSQYLLGMLYHEGRSGVVRQSAEKAHKWLSAAAAQGHEVAIFMLNAQKGEAP